MKLLNKLYVQKLIQFSTQPSDFMFIRQSSVTYQIKEVTSIIGEPGFKFFKIQLGESFKATSLSSKDVLKKTLQNLMPILYYRGERYSFLELYKQSESGTFYIKFAKEAEMIS